MARHVRLWLASLRSGTLSCAKPVSSPNFGSATTHSTRREWLTRACAGGIAGLYARRVQSQERAAAVPYVRPFGPRAPWNVPIEHIPRHADSNDLVQRLFFDPAGARNTKFQIALDAYAYAVYSAAKSTGPAPIKTYWPTNLTGKIPWNPAWKPAVGLAGQMIVLDEENGLEWDLSEVDYKLFVVNAATANLVPGDYRTNEVGFPPSRGSGIPFLAMLVRPAEIRAGVIEHALSMSVGNISGFSFVAPATKLEFPRGGRAGIPAGTRYSLIVTDAEIDLWLRRLPKDLSDRTRETARIIAVALRDYGWFVTDVSLGNLLHFESRVSAEREWLALGLDDQTIRKTEYPRDLVAGLLTSDRIVAYPPSDQYPEAWRAR
ncbi:MAG: hypothetical protein B7Z55_08225 [Planctomycetales bacterium 12-60-4]|nr:MAG: hypothetical protein B7Z55_08225 [Planctomycetales bacterium 12-60-4]